VLLGASNLTRGISTVIETARLTLGSPLDVYAALGHGRSYGTRSSILFGARALPGIVESDLWDALHVQESKSAGTPGLTEESTPGLTEVASAEAAGGRPGSRIIPPNPGLCFGQTRREETSIPSIHALITDIGNDIIYGAPPQKIASWIEQCIDRLQHLNASIAMTALPIESIRSVSRWQYAVVKSMLYPTRQLSFEDAVSRANQLHDLIVDLAQRRGVRLIPQRSHWYGFDPIHVRYRHWPGAWAEILGACAIDPAGGECAQPSLSRWLRLRTATPRKWWLFGMQRGRSQPAATLPDGTTISLY
jgi:hypothetical protein